MNLFIKNYYVCKKYIPRSAQLAMRRARAEYINKLRSYDWLCSNEYEFNFKHSVWKDGKKFCLVLTHDVDTWKGLSRCDDVMNLEKDLGFRSSFSIVPERYEVDRGVVDRIHGNGFEVCVHGLNHDGNLFANKKIFNERKVLIEKYMKRWNAKGFRSPAMHHDLLWISELDIEYDMSTYEYDPFEPQGGGVGTIFPFLIQNPITKRRVVEIPYTLPQDHTLFIILHKKGIDDWVRKLDFIAERGGMATLITHPDYMNFGDDVDIDEYSSEIYSKFLEFINEKYHGTFWNALPGELARFWNRNEQKAFEIGAEVLKGKRLCRNCRKNLPKVVMC